MVLERCLEMGLLICNLVVGEKGKICGKIDLKKRFWIEDIDTIS